MRLNKHKNAEVKYYYNTSNVYVTCYKLTGKILKYWTPIGRCWRATGKTSLRLILNNSAIFKEISKEEVDRHIRGIIP
jgi:hypothetical protein